MLIINDIFRYLKTLFLSTSIILNIFIFISVNAHAETLSKTVIPHKLYSEKDEKKIIDLINYVEGDDKNCISTFLEDYNNKLYATCKNEKELDSYPTACLQYKYYSIGTSSYEKAINSCGIDWRKPWKEILGKSPVSQNNPTLRNFLERPTYIGPFRERKTYVFQIKSQGMLIRYSGYPGIMDVFIYPIPNELLKYDKWQIIKDHYLFVKNAFFLMKSRHDKIELISEKEFESINDN